MKKILNHIFIEGLSGMASGLFATLIIGTIIGQAAAFFDGSMIGVYLSAVASVAKVLTGAGIGVAVACRFGSSPLVAVSAGVCGMVGAYAGKIASGALFAEGAVVLAGPGDPLGAFIASLIGIEIGKLVSGRTSLDIIITPLCAIGTGCAAGLLAGPPLSSMMTALGSLIVWATEQQPFLMGILVSVFMGMILTLPISSAAIGVILGLSGISAGAATVGCCAQMVGFAVASFRDNGVGGLISQGIGTSMLQVPNILRKPVIWLPVIITSAVLGPVATCVLKMSNNAAGCGMGTAGLVGPITAYQTMTAAGTASVTVMIYIFIMCFVAPAILSAAITAGMKRLGWIKPGDMKLE